MRYFVLTGEKKYFRLKSYKQRWIYLFNSIIATSPMYSLCVLPFSKYSVIFFTSPSHLLHLVLPHGGDSTFNQFEKYPSIEAETATIDVCVILKLNISII